MNCQLCQNLINEFLDKELAAAERVSIETHLVECENCAVLFAELSCIGDAAIDLREDLCEPPNADAMWLRISNVIEAESAYGKTAETTVSATASKGFFSQLANRSWNMNFGQMATAFAGVVVVTALVTVIGLQNLAPNAIDQSSRAATEPSLFEKYMRKWRGEDSSNDEMQRIESENRFREQQILVDYWNQRAEMRRQGWNPQIRAAFDRNLTELNQVVYDYREQLRRNPQDNLSEEMLKDALQEKVELLREFAEL